MGPGDGRALRTLEGHSDLGQWRGGDAGRQAGGFRVLGQNAEGVGPGDGSALRTLEGHSDSVNGVAVTADGQRAVSASRGQHAEGVGPGERPRAAHAGRPLGLGQCAWR